MLFPSTTTTTAAAEVNIGIDVAKQTLEIAVHATGEHWAATNCAADFPALTARLQALTPTRIILEATGGCEAPLAAHLAAAGLPVLIINPRQARDFAKATGQLAKSDRVDARLLAHFGAALQPPVRPLPDEQTQALAALLTRRRQLVEMHTAEQNRLAAQHRPAVQRDIQAHLTWLEERLAQLDDDLDQGLQQSPVWRGNERLLRSVPGVGPVTARTLLWLAPELGQLTSKQLAALIGVAPRTRQSGRWHGAAHIGGGRGQVRAVLYMATLTALRCNPIIQAFYQRLLAAGKAKKVALVACMHKLLTILNAMLKQQTAWNPALSVVEA